MADSLVIPITMGTPYEQASPSYTGKAFDGKTTDGDATGSWYAFFNGAYQPNGYVGKDLGVGADKPVASGVGLFTGNTAYDPRNFTVEGSNDGAVWDTLLSVVDAPHPLGWTYYYFENGTKYRWLIIRVSANWGGATYLIIREVTFLVVLTPANIIPQDCSAAEIAPRSAQRTDRHRLAGTVTVDGLPAQKRILVIDRNTFAIYAQTLSNPVTGAWEVYGLPQYPERSLLVLAFDDTGNYNAEVADQVSQVTMV